MLVAALVGLVIFGLGSPLYRYEPLTIWTFWNRVSSTAVRLAPFVLLFTLAYGVPLVLLLRRQLPSRWIRALLYPVIGTVPGVCVIVVGVAFQSDVAFVGLMWCALGAWMLGAGSALAAALARRPSIPTIAAGVLVTLTVIGAVVR